METESDEFAELEVEAVIDKKTKSRKKGGGETEIFYRVRWKGYGPEDDTWEPLTNLAHAKRMVIQFEKQASAVQQQPVRPTLKQHLSPKGEELNLASLSARPDLKRRPDTGGVARVPMDRWIGLRVKLPDGRTGILRGSGHGYMHIEIKNEQVNVRSSEVRLDLPEMTAGDAFAEGGDGEEVAEEGFEVESVLEMRGGSRKTRQYRVRWKGYSADDDTWEPRSNLGEDGQRLAEQLEQRTAGVAEVLARAEDIVNGASLSVRYPDIASQEVYPALVIDTLWCDSGGDPATKQAPRVQVHYRGWKDKWDEWVNLDSGRIQLAPKGPTARAAAAKPYKRPAAPESRKQRPKKQRPESLPESGSKRKKVTAPAGKTKAKREWYVGDHVKAFMGKTGPYLAVVKEVHGGPSDREYTLDWDDGDPEGRRQPAANVKPLAPADSDALGWFSELVGRDAMLPGLLWGVYGDDEETTGWAQAHRNELFQVTVVSAAEEGFTIQYQDEEPYVVLFDHVSSHAILSLLGVYGYVLRDGLCLQVWPFLASDQQRRARTLGVQIPENALQVWKEFSVAGSTQPPDLVGHANASKKPDRASSDLSHKLGELVKAMEDDCAAKKDPSAGRLWVIFRNEANGYDTYVYQITSYDSLQHYIYGHWVGGKEDGVSQILRPNGLFLSPFLEEERPPSKGFMEEGSPTGVQLCVGGWSLACVDNEMQARLMAIRRWHKAKAGGH